MHAMHMNELGYVNERPIKETMCGGGGAKKGTHNQNQKKMHCIGDILC